MAILWCYGYAIAIAIAIAIAMLQQCNHVPLGLSDPEDAICDFFTFAA
ncbi:hypothetical protein NST68_23520 [Paenibacillus sp. FSL E2-0230]